MYFIHDGKRKYYRARVVRDLIGALVVTKDHGSMVNSGGRRLTLPVSSLAEAEKELEKVAKVRKRHGYRVAPDPDEKLLAPAIQKDLAQTHVKTGAPPKMSIPVQ